MFKDYENAIPFEPHYELVKGSIEDRNYLFELYYNEIAKNVMTVGKLKHIDFNVLIGHAYLIFIKKCDEYDPYYGGKFYPFLNYVLSHIITNCYSYCQRYYYHQERITTIKDGENMFEIIENARGMAREDEEYNINMEQILSIIEKINPRIRTIIELRMQGYEQHEIGDKLGISQSRISVITGKFATNLLKVREKEFINVYLNKRKYYQDLYSLIDYLIIKANKRTRKLKKG